MAYQNEGRAALASRRPSECLSRQIDNSENSTAPRIVQRLSRRFGLTPAVAATIAELAFPTTDTWRATR